jgi:hypothetical protein
MILSKIEDLGCLQFGTFTQAEEHAQMITYVSSLKMHFGKKSYAVGIPTLYYAK